MGRITDLKRKGVERSNRLLAGEKSILEMIALGRPLREMLDALARTIEEQAEGLICSILLLDEQGRSLRHGAAPSLHASFHKAIDGIEIGPRTSPCGAAAHSGESVIVSDITSDPAWAHNKALALQYGLRACWSVPIKSSAGRVLGTFALYDRRPRLPTVSDLEVLDRAQHLAGIILERNRAEAELIRANNELRLMSRARAMITECNRVLVRSVEEKQLLQEMCRIGVESGRYLVAWVGLAQHDAAKTIHPVAVVGDHERYFEAVRISWADDEYGSGPAGLAVRTGTTQVTRDAAGDPRFKTWRTQALARGYLAVAALPLVHEGETYGLFGLFSGDAGAFSSDEIALLEELANDIAYGIFNLRTRDARRRAEVGIERSEQRFHSTFDLAPVGINHIDPEGRILLANPRMGQILGYTPDELIGRNIKEFSLPEDEKATKELWALREKLYAGEIRSISAERRYRHKDGSPVLVAITITAQRDAEGRLLYDITALEDITARKREERLLLLEHSVTRCLAQAESAPIALVSVIRAICESEGWDGGRYFCWDDEANVLRFRDAWGVPAPRIQEFIKRSRDLVFPPGQGLVGRVWQTNQPLWVADINSDPRALRASFALDLGIRGAFVFPVASEGNTIGVLVFSSSEIRQPDERLLGAVHAIGSQVGQFLRRARAEDVLRRSEERFRSLTELSSDMYWEQDDQYRFTVASGSGPDWIIQGRRRAVGKKRWDFSYLNMTERDWADHIALLDTRKPFHDLELCRLNESGRRVWVNVSGEPVFDPAGTFTGYRGIGKDITERKRAEQLQALEHAVNRSLADADNARAAVEAAIRAICETEGWECGRYLRWAERDGVLRFSESWNVPGPAIEQFIERSRDMTYAPGAGLAGRVWQTGEPLWVPDIARDPRVSKSMLARDTGMHGAFVFPVISEGKTIGVLAFNSREVREPEERLLQAIGVIGSQIGQFLQRKEGEEELRRFRAAMDASADLILLVDSVRLRYVDVNDAACRALGYSREEFLTMGPQDIFSISREELVQLYDRLINGDRSEETVEGWYRRKDGSRLPVESFRRAVCSPDGNIVVAVARDVTERRRRDEDLRRFRAAMDVSAEMIWLIDPVGMRIIDVNETACRKLNYSREELLAKGPHDLINVTREELAKSYSQLIASDQPETTAEGWYCRKDGSRFAVEASRRAVRSEDGHVIVAVVRDVTEQRAAEEDLRRFRLALDNSADMIVLIDRTTMRFVDVNATACNLLGYTRDELLQMGPHDLLPVSRAQLERSYDELIANPSLNSGMNTTYRRKDGSLLPFESTRRVLRSGDTYIIAAISRDIRERIASEAALRESNERFDTAVRATNDVIWDWNLLTDARWWNENFSKVFGYPSEKVDPTIKSWYGSIHPEDRDGVVAGTRRLIESGGEDWSDEYRFRREDGSYAHVFDRGHVIHNEEGKAVRMIGAMADITSRKQAEEKVRNQALQQRSIAEFGQEVLASADLGEVRKRAVELIATTFKTDYCDVLELNPDGKQVLYKAAVGWPEEWVGRRTVDVVPGSNLEYTLSNGETVAVEDLQKETRFPPSPMLALGVRSTVRAPILGANGAIGLLRAHWREPRHFTEDEVSFLRNVANILAVAIERKNAEERLAYLAQFDALTGLPNRHLFHDRLLQTMAQGRRSGNPMAVLYVDLDRFKLVNDTQGHGAGDKLLKEAAARLTQCIRSGDTVGRFGGDEFGAVLSDLAKPGDASIVAQKIIDALARPFDLDGHETYVSASVGITLFPADSEEAGALIMNADTAMYRAKEQGRNTYQYFTREMNERVLARMQVEAALRRALERKEFLLHYQPKVDLESGVISGFEALLRWQHPERGMVSPVEFIPVLEDAGLIVPVGEWVMREVCRQIQSWKSSGLAVPPVAVNLSARQFLQKELEATVRLILRESGVDPSLIQFELTESLLMKEPEAAARTLRGLKESGVKILVDDFGTGYSSLAYLKRFPIDALKIDSAFVRDVTTNPEDAAITLAIIGLAHSLKLKVVAEGVETEGQLNFLSTHACDEMQGYYFSRAVPPSECEAMLREGRRLIFSASGAAVKPAVLLLDDDERDLMLLEQILRLDGFPVLKTTDPKRAFELLASHPVGIVISDQCMPGLTGVEFLSHVRKLYPDVIRIVATGSHDPKAFADAVNEAGVHKFLMKDWDGERLRAEVRDVSRRYRARAAAKILPRGKPEKALPQTLDT